MIHTVTCNELSAGLYLQAQKYIQSLPFMPQQDLEKIFRGANPLGGRLHHQHLKFECQASRGCWSLSRSFHVVSDKFSYAHPSSPSVSVSVSCRSTEAHAGSGLRREDLGQRGSVPRLLLTVPRSGRRAGGPALRSDTGE